MENYNHLIGKRISVPDPRGGSNLVGTCTYAQINSLHGKFQVTIGRTPVWPVDPNKIKILDNN
jgi:hypothetical protein